MQRVIGMDIHRTFAEVVFWEAGRLRPAGRIDMTRSGLEGSAAVCQGRRGRRRGDRQRHGGSASAQPLCGARSFGIGPVGGPNGRQPTFLDPTAGTR